MDVHDAPPTLKCALLSLDGQANDGVLRQRVEGIDVTPTQTDFSGAAQQANVGERLDDFDCRNQDVAGRRTPLGKAGARGWITTLEVFAQSYVAFPSSEAQRTQP